MKSSIASFGLLLAATANAQQSAYSQCGGLGFTGDTTCVAGYQCVVYNPYYSQCVPGTATSSTTLTTSTTRSSSTLTTSTAAPTSTGFKWFGISESCAEFGSGAYPGVWGKDFTFASTDTIDTLMSEGYNIFRFPFAMERMAVGTITASLDTGYLTNYSVAINHVTAKGGYAIIDPHNYGRYNGAIISDTTAFKTFWTNLATPFKNFDTNNEYHDMDITLVYNLNQAAIDGIRGTGATSQYIFAEGSAYSAAMVWNTTSDSLKGLTDPQNKLVYEMHLYLDSDNSGTSSTCYSTTVGVDRAVGATQWLRANGKLGILGEFAGGPNSNCMAAVTGLVNHLHDNSDVWTGALWWAAGPWWGDYMYSFEPPSGTAYTYYDSTLKPFAPGV